MHFFDIKYAAIDFTGGKGCRIIGVSGFRHKRRTNPFAVYEERAQLLKPRVCVHVCVQLRDYLFVYVYVSVNIILANFVCVT